MVHDLQMPRYKVVKLGHKRDREPLKRTKGVYAIKVPDRIHEAICLFFNSESIERALGFYLSDMDSLVKNCSRPVMR